MTGSPAYHWPIICTKGIYKVNETSSRVSKAGRLSPDNISGRPAGSTPGQTPVTADNSLICKFFECLGLLVNHKKSILDPFQQMEFLGFEIHSQPMTLSIPQEKMRKIQQDARRLMTKPSLSVRELAQFVGKATATM